MMQKENINKISKKKKTKKKKKKKRAQQFVQLQPIRNSKIDNNISN